MFVANDISMSSVVRASTLAPLSPRSIVLSLLLGSHPPRMPVGRILEFTSLFDLADGAVRTALSRMVATGDLVNDDGVYRLAGRLVERQAQQDVGRRPPPTRWDGTWWTVAVLPDRRTMTQRRTFRAWAVGSRLGELRPDLWLRPANVGLASDPPDALVTRGTIVTGDEQQLVAQLWDLDAIHRRSATHRRALDDAADRLDDADDRSLADAFVALAATQQFLRLEPQLPTDLTPHATADAVRARYADVVEAFQIRLAEFFAAQRADRVSTTAT
jgi:phenylacetic acid degradation operon negative regulatory protein